MDTFSVKSVSFKYKDDDVLKDISFDVAKTDFLTILGPNGTGKSTLLRLLAGALTHYEGAILFDGMDVKKYRRKEIAKKIAMVTQNFSMEFPFTVREVVLMGRYPHQSRFGITTKEDARICEESMALSDIAHLQNKIVLELSAGEMQRVLIARALCQTPLALLLDEPTAHLDINHQIELNNLIKRLNKENGLTILNVSHDLNSASLHSSRIMLLKDGQIFAIGAPKEVITEKNIKSVFKADVAVKNDIDNAPYVVVRNK